MSAPRRRGLQLLFAEAFIPAYVVDSGGRPRRPVPGRSSCVQENAVPQERAPLSYFVNFCGFCVVKKTDPLLKPSTTRMGVA
jgi:hypothetical protein